MAASFWAVIGVICVVAILTDGVVKIVKAAKSGGGKYRDRVEDLEDMVHDLSEELKEARGRIEVLEKIVTDQKYDLGREIDDLASKQP